MSATTVDGSGEVRVRSAASRPGTRSRGTSCDSSSPSTTSVWRACFHSTGLNAGTPLEMASTPVIAVLPEASACSATNIGTPARNPRPAPVAVTACSGATSDPVSDRITPDHEQRHDARDEHVGRCREELARLAHPSEVPVGDQRDERHRHLDAERSGRGHQRDERGDAGRHRHGDRQDVVRQQGDAGHLRGDQPEVVLGDDVGAAGRGIRLDRLAVAEHQDRQDGDDRRRTAARSG